MRTLDDIVFSFIFFKVVVDWNRLWGVLQLASWMPFSQT